MPTSSFEVDNSGKIRGNWWAALKDTLLTEICKRPDISDIKMCIYVAYSKEDGAVVMDEITASIFSKQTQK